MTTTESSAKPTKEYESSREPTRATVSPDYLAEIFERAKVQFGEVYRRAIEEGDYFCWDKDYFREYLMERGVLHSNGYETLAWDDVLVKLAKRAPTSSGKSLIERLQVIEILSGKDEGDKKK